MLKCTNKKRKEDHAVAVGLLLLYFFMDHTEPHCCLLMLLSISWTLRPWESFPTRPKATELCASFLSQRAQCNMSTAQSQTLAFRKFAFWLLACKDGIFLTNAVSLGWLCPGAGQLSVWLPRALQSSVSVSVC